MESIRQDRPRRSRTKLPGRGVDLAPRLNDGLGALGLTLPDADRRRLLDYVELLGKWNQVYNLTAIRDPEQMLIQHVFDSLAIVAPLRRYLAATAHPTAIDVGSGAGLPGIPLAIAWPDLSVSLVEPVGKKAAFLRQALAALGLSNVTVEQCRIEALPAGPKAPDVVISRAFASLANFIHGIDPLVKRGSLIAAMKGQPPSAELAELDRNWALIESISLRVPGLDAPRHLLLLARS